MGISFFFVAQWRRGTAQRGWMALPLVMTWVEGIPDILGQLMDLIDEFEELVMVVVVVVVIEEVEK
jgi:hypothetical protein